MMPSVRLPRVQDQQNAMVWEVLKQPAFSPDLLPSDFQMFGPLKKSI
jgi:hypothetical protein